LEIFNKALLSKQIWRLLQNPNSLAAKILKAKYYPSCSILEASIGNRPSYVWRSFMAAQPVLQNGLIWRVGDGNDIGIWIDKWVVAPQILIVLFLIYLLDNIIQLFSLRSLWYYGG
jgi:hypothetical protein